MLHYFASFHYPTKCPLDPITMGGNFVRRGSNIWLWRHQLVHAPQHILSRSTTFKDRTQLTVKPIWVIVFLLLKYKHNCPLMIFLVIALMMKFCKSLRRQLRGEFPMTASFPSDKSALDRSKKLWKTFCRGNYLLLQWLLKNIHIWKNDDSPMMMMMISIRLSLMKSNAVAP